MVTELRPAVEDTAAPLSPDTAPEAVEVQPPPATESTTPAPGTDSASVQEPTETVDPLADFEDAALTASPRLQALLAATTKDVEARKDESHRQSLAVAQQAADTKAAREAYERQLAEMDAVDNGKVANELAAAIDRVSLGDPDARQRLQQELPALRGMAESLTRSTQVRLDRQNVDTLNAYLGSEHPDFRLPQAKVAAFDAALAKGDFTARRQIEYALVAEAAVAAREATLRTEIAKEIKAEAEKQLANERAKTSEATAQTRSGPTNVNGRPAQAANFRNRAEVAAAHAEGRIDNQQARQFYALPLSQLPEF